MTWRIVDWFVSWLWLMTLLLCLAVAVWSMTFWLMTQEITDFLPYFRIARASDWPMTSVAATRTSEVTMCVCVRCLRHLADQVVRYWSSWTLHEPRGNLNSRHFSWCHTRGAACVPPRRDFFQKLSDSFKTILFRFSAAFTQPTICMASKFIKFNGDNVKWPGTYWWKRRIYRRVKFS